MPTLKRPKAARPPHNAAADWAVQFVRQLTHSTGEYAGQPFNLQPWQETIIRRLFGTLGPDGRRQYRTAFIAIPRKNGKTELAAALALFMLLGDRELGAQVYGAAVDRDQATLVFTAASAMVRHDPELSRMVEIIPSTRRMLHAASSSLYRAIPGDAPSAHGYNASAVIYDELHAAPDGKLWDVLRTSSGARRQPLHIVITTAGYDRHSICWELWDYAEKVRDGLITDPTFLPVIYAAPPDADWGDETVWYAANPALGTFRSLDEMRIRFREAQEIPARQNTFRRLYLNQWTESATRWLDGDAWAACAGPVGWRDLPESLAGERVWLGLDLSSKQDLTAAALVCPGPDDRIRVALHFWIPEANLRQRVDKDRVPYDVWAREGALTLTPGNRVDYAFIRAWVREQASRYRLEEVDIDPWNATGLTTDLQEDGATVVEVGQNFRQLSDATKELEALVKARRLQHGGHPVLAWCAANVVVRQDPAGNVKPDKDKSTERIDGIVALITALAQALRAPNTTSIYESRGLVTL